MPLYLPPTWNISGNDIVNANTGKILFGTSGYDQANNRLGIGTAAPSNPLHVIGNLGTVILAQNTNSGASGGDTYLQLNSQNGNDAYVYQRNGTGRAGFTGKNGFSIDIYGGANTIAQFMNSGLVSIGNFSPGAVLDVSASGTSAASLRLRSGASPTSPNDGDYWNDSTQKATIGFLAGIKQTLVGTIFTQTADKSVTNTVTETSIVGTGVGTLTLPANFFVAGKTIRIIISGVYSTVTVTGDTVTIKVKYGSTVLGSVATTSLLAGASNLYFWAEALVTCRTTGASGTVQISGGVTYNISTVGGLAEDPINNGAATTTIDTTASSLLDVTVTHSAANASNTVKSLVSSFEVLN